MRWHTICIGMIALFIGACGGGSAAAPTSVTLVVPPSSLPDKVVLKYGVDSVQFGVLHLPTGAGPFPLLVMVHGGCWKSSVATYDFTEPLGDALALRGWAVWNLEFRSTDELGGGWPNTFLDVAAGIDYVRILKKTYAIDLARLVFAGHSSGGHLALWATGRKHIPATSVLFSADPLLPQRVIGLAAITDLETYPKINTACGASVPALIGNAKYEEVSPLQMLPIGVPISLLTAAGDSTVPLSQIKSYSDAAIKVGAQLRHVEVNVDHLMLGQPAGATVTAIMAELALP